jgi:hypothetical protein
MTDDLPPLIRQTVTLLTPPTCLATAFAFGFAAISFIPNDSPARMRESLLHPHYRPKQVCLRMIHQ